MVEPWNGQDDLITLAIAWMNEAAPGNYSIQKGMADLHEMRERDDADILILRDWDGHIIGAMEIQLHDMFFTYDKYVAVRYWYVLPEFRSLARQLIKAGKRWADRRGRDNMLICSNTLTKKSDEFLKKMRFTEFETVYRGEI